MFYQKYIVIESLVEELHKMDLSDAERMHLSLLIDSSLHHAILDEILSNLNVEDKKTFVKLMADDPKSEKLIEFLNEKIDNVEDKIKQVSDELIKEMRRDIQEAKNK